MCREPREGEWRRAAGHVSGFGQNVHQFIDLTAVAFTSGAMSASCSSSNHANLGMAADDLAASLPAAVGYGSVLITETLAQAGLQPLLAHPHTG
jgi:hypothetical protein